jgi:hypothetical protein
VLFALRSSELLLLLLQVLALRLSTAWLLGLVLVLLGPPSSYYRSSGFAGTHCHSNGLLGSRLVLQVPVQALVLQGVLLLPKTWR